MYAVEFKTINNNGTLEIPKEFNTFEDKEILRVIILKENPFSKHQKEVKDIFEDYKLNGEKNFTSYEESEKEISKWLDSLDENNKIR